MCMQCYFSIKPGPRRLCVICCILTKYPKALVLKYDIVSLQCLNWYTICKRA